MSEFRDTFDAPLTAIFGRDHDGTYHLDNQEDSIESSNDKALMLFVMSSVMHVWCDLHGTGLTLAFRDKKRAHAAAARLNPSFVSISSNGAVYLTYLFSDAPEAVNALADELMQGDSDDAYTATSFPMPYGSVRLSDDDLDVVDKGGRFESVTIAEFEAAFFSGDDPDDAGEAAPDTESTSSTGEVSNRVSDGVPTEMWNDAEVYGDLDAGLLRQKIQMAEGKDRNDKKWKTFPEFESEHFFKRLTTHLLGKKDGTCFVPGALAGPQRTNNAVTKMFMMGIDVDSGESLVETAQTIQDLGLFAVAYSTHSNGLNEIEIKQDKFFKWASDNGHPTDPTVALVKLHLADEKKYKATVIDSVCDVRTVHETTGIQIIAETSRPIDRFRIVFLLERPYVIAEQKMAQKDAIKAWGEMILGMGRTLGIHVDRAARDCSRLFYFPRHDKSRSKHKRVIVIAGRALDWTKINKVSVQESRIADPFGQAAHAMGANMNGRLTSPDLGLPLKTWVAERGHAFEISRVFDTHCPEYKKEETAPGKFTVTCPFDEDHSNAGDEDDKGCFIQDAGMYSETFAFRCSHDSCAGRDRLVMLNKAFAEGWFPDSILADNSYYCEDFEPEDKIDAEVEESEEEEESEDAGEEEEDDAKKEGYTSLLARATKLAGGLTQSYTHDQITAVIEVLQHLKMADQMRIRGTVCTNTKLSKTDLDKLCASFAKASKETVDDVIYDSKKASEELRKRFKSTKTDSRPFVAIDETHKEKIVDHIIDSLKDVNYGRKAVKATPTMDGVEEIKAAHGLFSYGEAPTLIAYNTTNDTFEMKGLDKFMLKYFIMKNLYLGKMIDGSTIVNEPAPDWLIDLVMASSSLPLLPLSALSELPYFNEEGRFVAQAGYDTKAKKYLKLRAEVAEKFGPGSKLYKTDPTMEDVDMALEELFGQVFANFPFDDGDPSNPRNGDASRAHLLCMMLQPIVRYMIKGPCPMYRINKPAPGTGASKLINSAMVISYGAKGTPGTLSMDEEENRKNITSQFSAGKPYIFYDNINVPITSTALAIIATSPTWQDRILGRTELTTVQNFMQVILAGNNISASEENSRRMLNIQLNLYANPEDPGVIARRTQSYKIKDLDAFVEEHKDTLFGYLVTIVNYWIGQGMPRWSGEPLASYEDFCKIMGGILECIEMPGFLGNRDITSKANSTDEMAWLEFFSELVAKKDFHEKPLIMSQIIQTYVDMDTTAPTLTINGTNWRVTGALHDDKKYDLLERMVTKQTNKVFVLQIKGESVELMLNRTIEGNKVMFQLVPNPHPARF